ncbi:hypothetical protein DSM19430T_12520 [Desulfovibrio psychrotolerans]|uniref:BON domain-containing protein n=2 Tax=Desulfovibrio psychrotolerans TaxID=415242 RepID=A0A7J0BSD5_9BACT|nr:hypothetical protein DSM19430T_12520 [Desulfovibrio psychrotolerans]
MVFVTLMTAIASLLYLGGHLYASEVDDNIVKAAKQSYVFKHYLKDDNVDVKSNNGEVTLTGTVSDDASRALARETVASLPGVKSVDNKLNIKGTPPEAHSDAWLITKVKTTLLFHRNVSGAKTEVLASNGTITLRGEAVNSAQRDLASEYAQDVDGVKNVKNEMTVQGTPVKPGEATMGEKLDAVGDLIDDASVTALVKITLLYHRSTSALNTTVSTKGGVVTLGGEAKSDSEKFLATKLANDVHGVKQVVNNMTVLGAN